MAEPMTQPMTQHHRLRRLFRSRSAWLGMFIVGMFVVTALSAGWLAPYPPKDLVGKTNLAPSAEFPLGTDSSGRDVLSRTLHGTRLSLMAGLVSISLALAIGVPAGAIAGYFGSWTDALIMRTVDLILAFPSILVAMLVVVALKPSWTAVILAVAFINIPIFARQIRATVLTVRSLDYVTACRAMGASPWYVLRRAVFPALVSPMIVLATLGLGLAILEVAGLSFLGISGQPDEPEWGYMLQSAKSNLRSSVWPALVPGVAISLAVLGFNLLGDGLRDALDPHLSKSNTR